MLWHDEVGAVADFEICSVDGQALAAEFVDFCEQADGVHDDAVSDDAKFVLPENAGGDEVQDVFVAPLDDGVAGVVAAGGAHHDIGVFGEHIDNFAFSFIAPLGTYNNDIGHGNRNEIRGGVRGNEKGGSGAGAEACLPARELAVKFWRRSEKRNQSMTSNEQERKHHCCNARDDAKNGNGRKQAGHSIFLCLLLFKDGLVGKTSGGTVASVVWGCIFFAHVVSFWSKRALL